MSARLRVKVIPGARQEALDFQGELLRVKVTAAPEKGRANDAVVALLARYLGLPGSEICVISGHTSPLKVLEFSSIDQATLTSKLSSLRT